MTLSPFYSNYVRNTQPFTHSFPVQKEHLVEGFSVSPTLPMKFTFKSENQTKKSLAFIWYTFFVVGQEKKVKITIYF